VEDPGPSQMAAWKLPVLVAGLVVPIVLAFLLGGEPVGFAAGALTAAAVIVIAARAKPDEPIEVARTGDGRWRVLVLADEAVDEPEAAQAVREAAARGDRSGAGDEPEVLVLAPARNRPLAHWTSDLREARLDAQRRLVLTIGALAAAEVEARGEVGDSDPTQAVEDVLRRFPADEVLVATGPAGDRDDSYIAELDRRLDLPVRRVVVTSEPVSRG
jgi:hypothetical protein